MPWFVYILQSQKNWSYYIGSSSNVGERVSRHNKQKVRSTKSKVPWKLVYIEEYPTRQAAYRRELQIKSYKGGEAFKKLIARVDTQAVNEGRL